MEESGSSAPELRLGLRDAIRAAIDNNVNVRLWKERIAAAQANVSLGALLPNVSGDVNGRNQTVNLAAFGLPADRLSGLGLTRSVAEPVEAMLSWVQSLMALSPLRYYIDVTYGILLKRVGLDVLRDSIVAMAVLGGVLFGLGMWRFRRRSRGGS
ncbi:MAG TPA: hypothetical protein VFX56_03290 [Nitrospira sp.]|nr:hypothetical protein [Nitrospira sp.]